MRLLSLVGAVKLKAEKICLVSHLALILLAFISVGKAQRISLTLLIIKAKKKNQKDVTEYLHPI
jgi:hypothetical protein